MMRAARTRRRIGWRRQPAEVFIEDFFIEGMYIFRGAGSRTHPPARHTWGNAVESYGCDEGKEKATGSGIGWMEKTEAAAVAGMCCFDKFRDRETKDIVVVVMDLRIQVPPKHWKCLTTGLSSAHRAECCLDS
jgi:hypothetical protein